MSGRAISGSSDKLCFETGLFNNLMTLERIVMNSTTKIVTKERGAKYIANGELLCKCVGIFLIAFIFFLILFSNIGFVLGFSINKYIFMLSIIACSIISFYVTGCDIRSAIPITSLRNDSFVCIF